MGRQSDSPALRLGGLLCLLLAIGASFMLALEHLGGLSLPGCGQGSPCAEVTSGPWGVVPGIGWPNAFLGLAYFVGAAVAWLFSTQGVGTLLRMVIRLGALISFGFIILLITEDAVCPYCVAAHVGNFGFWILAERRVGARAIAWRPLFGLGITFAVASLLLGMAEFRERGVVEAQHEEDRQATAARIIAADRERAGGETAEAERPWEGGFTGRYRWGPDKAAARIVMITDYQCPDCRRIEEDAMSVLEAHPEEVSLSIKYFPMCTACNPHVQRNLHPNGCWAARAALAAGILGGKEAYIRMHDWLFERKGSFTDSELSEGLAELGFERREFIQTMMGDETLAMVESDIEEAIWLGLHYTPMVFVNGIEMKGIFAREALIRTVEEVLAAGPPPMTAALDQPPPGIEKCVGDWQAQPRRRMPSDTHLWGFGPADAAARLVIFGDLQEPYTAQADSFARGFLRDHDGIRYVFRHYPVNPACNPETPRDLHPLACLASKAAEAAGQLGGEAAYQRMHGWLVDHRQELTEETLRRQVRAMGFGEEQFYAMMESDTVAEAIREDCAAATRLGLKSLPFLFVNERFVPRWQLKGDVALDEILLMARRQD